MYIQQNIEKSALPLYDVQELSMEEALLVLAAEKETLGNTRRSPAELLSGGARERVPGRYQESSSWVTNR